MNTSAAQAWPWIDASTQECITEQQAQFFRDNGLLVIRNALNPEELLAMQGQTLPLVQRAAKQRVNDPDYAYRKHELTGQEVPFRIEYMIDKTQASKALLGHPFILRSVEKIQGRNFIPTWDSMVFKLQGQGVGIGWHRDSGTGCGASRVPLFNVDFYLDGSDSTNCLWGILGSNLWSEDRARDTIERLNAAGGSFAEQDGCVPILMNPGDVIFHNILVLHGSPPAQSGLRRVVYYEFRPAQIETEFGPHTAPYIPLKQRVLLACLRERAATPYARAEAPFVYDPDPRFAPPALGPGDRLETYRYPHEQYWR